MLKTSENISGKISTEKNLSRAAKNKIRNCNKAFEAYKQSIFDLASELDGDEKLISYADNVISNFKHHTVMRCARTEMERKVYA